MRVELVFWEFADSISRDVASPFLIWFLSVEVPLELILSDSILVFAVGGLVFDFPLSFTFNSVLSHDARHSRSAAQHVLLKQTSANAGAAIRVATGCVFGFDFFG